MARLVGAGPGAVLVSQRTGSRLPSSLHPWFTRTEQCCLAYSHPVGCPAKVRPMSNANPRSRLTLGGRPLYAMLLPIPVVFFMATLVTDLVYWQTAAMQWANMSAWMLLIALIVSIFVVLVGLVDFFGDTRIRQLRAARIHAISYVTALVLSIFNCLVHTRDAYTSVVPSGLILSALVVVILLVTSWSGWGLVFRDGVGVRRSEQP